MDLNTNRPISLRRALKHQVRNLQRRANDTEAKLGWVQAHHAKEIENLKEELNWYREWYPRMKEELRKQRRESNHLEGLNTTLQAEATSHEARLQEQKAQIDQFKRMEDQLRLATLRDSTGRRMSSMRAAIYSDYTPEELLSQLREQLLQSQKLCKTMKGQHERRIRAMREEMDRESQRCVELNLALDDKLVKSGSLPQTSCGHGDHGPVGVTGCNQLLCEDCYEVALKDVKVNWHVWECSLCHKSCALLPLLKRLAWTTERGRISV